MNIFRLDVERQKNDHPWYSGGWSIQAHHLICSESMKNDYKWAKICRQFGYDINSKENGVMLPANMPLACQIHAPLHRGPHEAGDADGTAYPKKVKKLIDPIKNDVLSGNFCDDPNKLKQELNNISKDIMLKVDNFEYTLTDDGSDYKEGGNGCGGVKNIQSKPSCKCPVNRKHSLLHPTTGIIPKKSSHLQIGE